MNTELKYVDVHSPDFGRMKRLYKTAFPVDERAPFFLLSQMAKKEDVDFWGIYNDQKWVGLMYVVSEGDLSYLFYFAIDESERGKGCGSGALKALREKYRGGRIFLAIEQLDKSAPNYDERVKRKSFYERSGFTALNQRLREGSVVYELLGIGGRVEPAEYRRLMEKSVGRIMLRLVPMRIEE